MTEFPSELILFLRKTVRAAALTGAGVSQESGLPPWSACLPLSRDIDGDAPPAIASRDLEAAGQYCFDHELRIVRHGRDAQWLRVYGQTSELLPAGAPVTQRLYGVAVDITAERRVLEQLRVSEASLKAKADELQLAVEAARLGTWVWDLRTDQLTGSDIALQHYGLLPGTAISADDFLSHVHPDDRALVRKECLKVLRCPCHCEAEFRVIWPDGTEHWIHAAGQSRFSQGGVPEFFWGVSRDITEDKQSQMVWSRMLEQEQMLKRQVVIQTLQAMTHELHQPLQAVISLNDVTLNSLENTPAYTPELGDMLRLSAEQSMRAANVLRELMQELRTWGNDHSRLKAERLEALVARVIERAKRDHPGVVFKVSIPPGLPKVRCYDLQTEKILLNLVANAAEAMAQAGKSPLRIDINVSTVVADGKAMVQVSVRDYGPGIAGTEAYRVFDPFYSTKSNGMGLGLAISKSLVQAQGGEFSVIADCRPGARFSFTLPVADE
jgi:PAS domain S-box-containing protein